MKPDTRYVILMALYEEYIRDDGNFNRIGRHEVGVSFGAFGWALYRLQTEGLIAGCVFQPPHPGSAEKLLGVVRDGLYMTAEGVCKCERLLGVDRDEPDESKRRKLKDFFYDLAKDVMVEIIVKGLGIRD